MTDEERIALISANKAKTVAELRADHAAAVAGDDAERAELIVAEITSRGEGV